MKILFVTEHSIMGGGETNLLLVVNELVKNGFIVTVMCPSGLLADKLIMDENVAVIINDNLSKRGWLRFVPLFWRQIKKYNIDCDLIHFYSSNPIPRFFLYKVKKVWTVHGPWEMPFGIRGFFIRSYLSYIFAVSENVYSYISINNIGKEIVELGVKKDINLLERNKLSQTVNILCLGRFQKIKGQDLLLDAFIDNQDIHLNTKIQIKLVGNVDKSRTDDLEFYELIKEKVNLLNKRNNISVKLLTHTDDPKELYNWANICIIPSRYESFSMVAVESLLNGIPIIVSNSGAPQQFVKNGETGLIFNNECSRDLLLKIQELIESFDNYRAKNFIEYKERFSIERQVNDYCKVYRKLLGDE